MSPGMQASSPLQDAEDIHSLEKLVSLEHLNVAETRARKAKNSFGWQVPIEYVNSSVIGAISNLTRLTYLDVSASYGTYIPLLTDLQVGLRSSKVKAA